jgi:hypothetical protein
MSGNYRKETRERAVRLVREHSGDYASEWAAISAVAARLKSAARRHCASGYGRPRQTGGGSWSDDSGVERTA